MNRYFRRISGRWRLWWGLCPECNSDAPEMDTCPVCHGWRLSLSTPVAQAAQWWRMFCHRESERKPPAVFYYDERGVVSVTESPLDDPDLPGSICVADGIVTLVYVEPTRKIVETWKLPCPILTEEKSGVITTRQIVVNTGQRDDAEKGVKYAPSKWLPAVVFEIREAKL